MAKHLVDLDETALTAARAELGTALWRAASNREARTPAALDVLAHADVSDRSGAWR
ncbi:MAG: hypothetical protein WKF47_01775 [Geodermatophilaceae bacterium]|jgi:hypothetical protein